MKIRLTEDARVLMHKGMVVETTPEYAKILIALNKAEVFVEEEKEEKKTTTKKAKGK